MILTKLIFIIYDILMNIIEFNAIILDVLIVIFKIFIINLKNFMDLLIFS